MDPRTPTRLAALTERQRDCLEAAVAFGSIGEAARAIYLSRSTVRNHLADAYKRARLRGLVQAAYLLGVEHGRAEGQG